MKATVSALSAALLFAFAATPAIAHADAAAPTAAASAVKPMEHLAWTRAANIYEVNIRQFSKEGTFAAVTAQLPRLKKMGVDIVWLMPIHPIGERNRKGSKGSYYAVRDYKGVNPEYGTLDDLRTLVKQAHALGMHVLLDWVGNHTAWDNPWASEHPDWFKKDDKGNIHSVTFKNEAGGTEEWTDVIGLDFSNKALWAGMTDAMAYWVREADIDGFRCDAAGLVPTPYWDSARAALDQIKPMFMLAEWSSPDLHEHAFDMTYAWDLKDVFMKIGKGKGGAQDLRDYVTKPPKVFPRDAYRMLFTNNHDINSWDGTDKQLYGPAYRALALLSFTLPGMPLIYDGQEAGLDKKLEFFEKDAIDFSHLSNEKFYSGLIALKKRNPALWNGQYGGDITLVDAGNADVFAFRRTRAGNSVTVAVNLTATPQRYTLPGHKAATLAAWDWRIDAAGK